MCSYVHTYVWRRGRKREKEREKAKQERFVIATGLQDYGDQEVIQYAINVSRTTRKLVLQFCSVQLEDEKQKYPHLKSREDGCPN